MKKMKKFRTTAALLLAVMMVFSALPGLADGQTDVEVLDEDRIQVNPAVDQNGNLSYGNANSELSQVVITDVENGKSVDINSNNVKYEGADEKDAIHITDNHGEINIETKNNIVSETDDGIEIVDNNGEIKDNCWQMGGIAENQTSCHGSV